jgi:Transglycosylase SLT domain/Domain of unknown function (DUF4124)
MRRTLSAALATVGLLLAAAPARAGSMFQFEDEQGVVHYTNIPSDPRYRFVRQEPDPRPVAAKSASGGTQAPARGLRAFSSIIRAAAERYGVDARLVEAVVQTESAGNPGAVSPKGARGLMQLMPERAAELGVRDVFDPVQNVDGGVRHMRDLLQRFSGDLTLALAAYNAGEAAVRTYGGVPPYPETREYVRRVRLLYDGGLLAGPTLAQAPSFAPQRIYREEAADGTLTFTNLPPRPGVSRRF